MTPTPENPQSKFSLGHNAMDNRTLYLTLAASAGLAFVAILIIYAWIFGRNPLNRLGYGFFVSVLPALCALLVVKLTRLFVSWRGAATVYIVLFVLFLILQAFGRMIPV